VCVVCVCVCVCVCVVILCSFLYLILVCLCVCGFVCDNVLCFLVLFMSGAYVCVFVVSVSVFELLSVCACVGAPFCL